jgi:hypothetical protein
VRSPDNQTSLVVYPCVVCARVHGRPSNGGSVSERPPKPRNW